MSHARKQRWLTWRRIRICAMKPAHAGGLHVRRYRMTTPLYPTFQKRISDSFDQLIRNQVTPWAFLNSGKPMRVKTNDQREIFYEGGGFEGSPQDVFWSRYIEPFMEDISINEIDAAVNIAEEKNVDATLLLPEVEGLLLVWIVGIIRRLVGL